MAKTAVFYDERDGNSIAAAAIVRNKYPDSELHETSVHVASGTLAAEIAAMDTDFDEIILAVNDTNLDYVAEVLATAEVTFTHGGAAGEIMYLTVTPDVGVHIVPIGVVISAAGSAADAADLLVDSINDGTMYHGFTAAADLVTPEQVNIAAPAGSGALGNAYVLAIALDDGGVLAATVTTTFAVAATGVAGVAYHRGEFHVSELAAVTAITTTLTYTYDNTTLWTAEKTWVALYPTVQPPRLLLFLSYNVDGVFLGTLCDPTIDLIENVLADIETYEYAWRKLLDYYGDANDSNKHQTVQDLRFLRLLTYQTLVEELTQPMKTSDEK